LCLATGLSPYLGYKVTAELVKEALHKSKTLKQEVLDQNFMSEKDLNEVLSPAKLTAPSLTDKTLADRIKKSKTYQDYLKKL